MFLLLLFVCLFDSFFTFFASSFLQLTSAIEIQDFCPMQGMALNGLKRMKEAREKEREREIESQPASQPDRETDRQTDRQAGRQTGRQRQTEANC